MVAATLPPMNYTNGAARCHVIREAINILPEKVLSLEMTKHGWRLCTRKPATLARRREKQMAPGTIHG